jgi:metal-dependent amidase/aminoacylase/carboxypeptidase family protein
VKLVLQAGVAALGQENIYLLETPTLAGEDFSQYLQQVPGAFVFIGAGNPEKGIVHSVHQPLFDVDEQMLLHGAKLHVQLVKEALGGEVFRSGSGRLQRENLVNSVESRSDAVF